MITYNVDYEGILRIYKDNMILVEFIDCDNMSDEQLKTLVKDYLEESEEYL